MPSQISQTDKNLAEITPQQAYGLGVIKTLLQRGYPPTITEIAHCLDVKKQTAGQLLVILERKGYILRDRGVVRSLRLTGKTLPYATKKVA